MCNISMFLSKVRYVSFTYTYAFSIVKMLVFVIENVYGISVETDIGHFEMCFILWSKEIGL